MQGIADIKPCPGPVPVFEKYLALLASEHATIQSKLIYIRSKVKLKLKN
jgi:hypothetical protein